MKKLICVLLALLLLCGCGAQAPTELTVDSTFVIVCAEDVVLTQAAISLQSNLKYGHGLELELVTAAPAEGKTITVAVDSALAAGEYRTRLTQNGVVIEAQSAQVMTLAMRSICAAWPSATLTADDCAALSDAIVMEAAPFLVLTQNIRFDNDEGGNMVADRAPRFKQLVNQYQPDIMCIQEDDKAWAPILERFFSDRYGFTGMYSGGPDRGQGTEGLKQLIFFRSDRYELVEEGGFWMSDTPTVYSKFEGSKSIRSCTWALLKDNHTQQNLLVCNVHLDTRSNDVRLQQLNVVYEQLGSYMEQYPTIFCGDFNSRPDSAAYADLASRFNDPHETATEKYDDYPHTFTNYGNSENPGRLDYMFYTDVLTANRYRIMTNQYGGYISDHYGVMTEYSFVK